MKQVSVAGGFTDAPVDAARAFRIALDVMARPGTIQTLTGAQAPEPVSPAAATLLLTLCDAQSPLYLAGAYDTKDVRDWIAFHIGAPIVDPAQAMFALGAWQDLQAITAFPIGTSEFPDRSTTLIVERDHLNGEGAQLTGPGIAEMAHFDLPDVNYFIANSIRYPLGNDYYFTADTQIAALPRSTKLEAATCM